MSQDEIAGARPKGMLAGNLGSTGGATTDVSWHCLDIAGTLSALGSRSGGLSSAEAAERLAVHGPNELQAARRISPWSILFEQCDGGGTAWQLLPRTRLSHAGA